MMRVVVSEFTTLDGVFEDPGGVEGTPHGGWAFGYDRGPEGDRFKLDEISDAEALLLGRRTFVGFAEAWPSRTDDSGFADQMNGIRKYVASTSPLSSDWNNSVVVTGDLIDQVRQLVDHGSGILLVVGSGSIVRQLVSHDLVDEIRLMVFPTVLGTGATLFEGTEHPRGFSIRNRQQFGATALIALDRSGSVPSSTERSVSEGDPETPAPGKGDKQ
jgi:dihydrofolate reductase